MKVAETHWHVLTQLWERSQQTYQRSGQQETALWSQQQQALFALGINMEETLRFLFHERPALDAFRNWILINSINTDRNELHSDEDVLSQADLDYWNENGYVVVRNAISEEQCIATRNAIWEFLNAQPDNPESWYVPHEEQRGLMLLFSNHPTLMANRESSRIRKAYEQLYRSSEIFLVVDKVSFNPPVHEKFQFRGSDLHWDTSLALPVADEFQGLLYLTDCDSHEGAFHCVPGFHLKLEQWINSLPEGSDPRTRAPQELKSVPVSGKAGDFVIWHQALPHCATPNHGTTPRLVQYLTWLPIDRQTRAEWK